MRHSTQARRRPRLLAIGAAATLLALALVGCTPDGAGQQTLSSERQAPAAQGTAPDKLAPAAANPAATAAPVQAEPAPTSPHLAPRTADARAPHAEEPSEPEPTPPAIVADEATFDFGTVEQGAEVVHQFTVRNHGEGLLVLERADAG